MDEIGRGTGTDDGLALAWCCAVYLAAEIGAYSLFATHFFELTSLPAHVQHTENVHVEVVEHGDKIVFLHAVKEGPADRSYGLHVAQLAGVPKSIIEQAKTRLRELEQRSFTDQANQTQTDMFTPTDDVIEELAAIKLDEISPKQALDVLFHLQSRIERP